MAVALESTVSLVVTPCSSLRRCNPQYRPCSSGSYCYSKEDRDDIVRKVLILHISAMMMEAECSPEALVPVYKTTQHQERHDLNYSRHENLKIYNSRKLFYLWSM
jgi:hypothetical protein